MPGRHPNHAQSVAVCQRLTRHIPSLTGLVRHLIELRQVAAQLRLATSLSAPGRI